LLTVLLAGAIDLAPTPKPPDAGLVREAGNAGGPIDVRVPGAPGRGLVVAEGTLAVDGVPVRGVEADDVPVDTSCLVGDFVGDYSQC